MIRYPKPTSPDETAQETSNLTSYFTVVIVPRALLTSRSGMVVQDLSCIVGQRSLRWMCLLKTCTAPAKDAVQYIVEVPAADAWDNMLYVGEPSYKGDFAWNDLMRCTSLSSRTEDVENLTYYSDKGLRLSNEEASRLKMKGVSLPNSGHGSMLGVYHNLHCLLRTSSHMIAVL